ncbi:MAG TPA: GNAT family N-acetyltransferase [Thermoplasmata archaeon]|nr:GNAT family N-acetyltransferase [Thermoplasmata archaeon]
MSAVEPAVLRFAGPQDVDALHRFEALCFRERRFRREHVDWILRNERAVTLIVDGPAGVRGAIMMLFEGPVCRILSVAVAPHERRRGIGTRLMAAAEDLCRDRGYASIRLEVSTQNLTAIEFYRRLGYRTDGVLYGYYTWGEDAYSMQKEIALIAHSDAPGRRASTRYSS